MTRRALYSIVATSMLVMNGFAASVSSGMKQKAASILRDTGTTGGLIVHVGCGDGKLTAALRTKDSCLVHGLDTKTVSVTAARKHIPSLGLYGPVTIDRFDGKHLPYVDNLVRLLVADDLGAVSQGEVMRVLAPLGVAYIKGKKIVKPWPKEIDDWTRYLYNASNNAVSKDFVVLAVVRKKRPEAADGKSGFVKRKGYEKPESTDHLMAFDPATGKLLWKTEPDVIAS